MILDTNAFSALADGEEGAELKLEEASELILPTIVYGEYFFGVLQSNRREKHLEWLSIFLGRVSMTAVDRRIAESYAAVRLQLKLIGKPIPANDMWIAATALNLGMPILSRDGHFDAVEGLKRIDY